MKRFFGIVAVSLILSACGGSGEQPAAEPADPSGLTADELENGLGPIRSISLAEIDDALAAQGEELFVVKCSACHKMADRYVGPALGDVTTRRTAPFIMNMILNPEEMVQRHPEGKAMLQKFMTPMANQNLTEEEARAVLEFLRTQTTN